MAGWSRDAKAYREAHQGRLTVVPYGPGERHRLDLFVGDRTGPIVVFIHGGYWQALDGSSFSHLARGLNAHGIDVAVPTYDLCPNVSIDDIILQMRSAVARTGKTWAAARDQRSFGRRASRGLHAGDGLACRRCVPDGNDCGRGLHHFGVVRPSAAGQNVDQQGARSRRGVGEGGQSVVLETAGARHSSMPWSAATRAPNTSGRAGSSSMPGARQGSRRGSQRCPTPTILPPSRRSPTPTSPMTLRLKQLAGR